MAQQNTENWIETEAKMHVNITHEERDNKAEGVFKFDGLDARIWLSMSAELEESRGSKKEDSSGSAEPNEEPTAVKKIIDAAPEWKINFFE